MKALSLTLALFSPQDESTSLLESLTQIDAGAILRSWRIKGIEVCWRGGRPRVCLIVENAWPAFLIETLDRGGESLLSEGQGILDALTSLFGIDLRGAAGVSGPAASNHQMRESHVWGFTPPIVPQVGGLQSLMTLPEGPPFAPLYVSELDSRQWRSGELDALHFGGGERAGAWGSFYPRSGAGVVPSAPWMDFLTAARAGRIPNEPGGRMALGSSSWETRQGHFLQQLLPEVGDAVTIGSDVRDLEEDHPSERWRRLTVFLGIFEGCSRDSHGCRETEQVEAREP